MAGGNKGDYYVPRVKVGDDEDDVSRGSGESGSGGGSGKDPCDITQSVNLHGTDEAVTRRLKVGYCLEIQLLRRGDSLLIVAVYQGQAVGSISGLPTLSRLTKCLEAGVPFKATVIEIHLPGLVKVKLERGSCL